MKTRRRVIVWGVLAAVSAAAFVLRPVLLRFEPVEAVVANADLHYTVSSVSYERKNVRVPYSDSVQAFDSFDGVARFVGYRNFWFPGWYRWEEIPESVTRSYNALIGLSVVFLLLMVRDSRRVGRIES